MITNPKKILNNTKKNTLMKKLSKATDSIKKKLKSALQSGIEKLWVKNNGNQIIVSNDEWNVAECIMNQMLTHTTFPFKISRNEWKKKYPQLQHSFIVINGPEGPKLGALARGKSYKYKNKEIKEGILGHGKKGMVKLITYKDGTQNVLKTEPKRESKNDKELLKKLNMFIDSFIRDRKKSSPWLSQKGKAKFIQNKQYTILQKIEGQSLKNYLDSKNHLENNYELALKCAQALEEFQDKRLIHGDLHPGNFVIEQNANQTKITIVDIEDVLALKTNEEKILLDKPVGSRSYMAPEVGIWRQGWEKRGETWVKKKGQWEQRSSSIYLSSDIYSLGTLFERNLKLTNEASKKLIALMKAKDPAIRPSIKEIIAQLHKIKNQSHQTKTEKPITISVGQALLILIDECNNTEQLKQLKKLYLVGFRTHQDKLLWEKLKRSSSLNQYYISDSFHQINNDPTRRYFETHLSFETHIDALKNHSLDALKAHFNSIKSCFETLGGDLDANEFKKTGKRVLVRDYKKEFQQRKLNNKNADHFIRGISIDEQKEIDRLFSGEIGKADNDMHKEYADMIIRIKNSKTLSSVEIEKALLIIKSTRLSMILGNKIDKYRDTTYQGTGIPGEEIYKSGIYEEANRGRESKDLKDKTQNAVRSSNLGLLYGHMPIAKDDAAYTEKTFEYIKPSDRSTYVFGSSWPEYSMSQKVHTFSNAISGTMLVQLRTMLKLNQDGKLTLKTRKQLQDYAKCLISTMTYISGGHSLLEFSAPFQLKGILDAFQFIPGISEITFESLFYNDNEKPFETALQKTIAYNKQLLKIAALNNEVKNVKTKSLLVKLAQFKLQGYKTDGSLALAIEEGFGVEAIAFLKEKNILNQYLDPQLLHIAANSGDVKVIQSLLNAGVGSNLKNNLDKTALEMALDAKKMEAALLIVNYAKKDYSVILEKNQEFNALNNEYNMARTFVENAMVTIAQLNKEIIIKIAKFNNLSSQNEAQDLLLKASLIEQQLTTVQDNLSHMSKMTGFALMDSSNPLLPMVHRANALEKNCQKTLEIVTRKKGFIEQIAKINVGENNTLPEVMTIESKEIINQFKNKSDTVITQVAPENYSYLNPQNIYQLPGIIALMHQAMGGEIINSVSFKPERVLLHEAAFYVSTFLKMDSEKDRNDLIHKVATEMSDGVKKKLKNLFKNAHKKAKVEIEQILKGKQKGSNEMRVIIANANKMALPPSYCSQMTSEKLAIEIAAHKIYTKKVNQQIENMVADYFKAHPFYKYKTVENNSPVVMFVGGGQASGKGTLIANLLLNAQNKGLDPQNFVYLNNDSYKELLKNDSMDQKLFSQLTHEEAKRIRDKVFKKSMKENRNMLMDQVSISKSATKETLNKKGVVKGVVVSTKVEEALSRAFARTKSSGRYEDTQSLLQGHQNSVLGSKQYLQDQIGNNVQVDFFDNNNTPGVAATLFMEVNCKQKTVVVHDDTLLKEFIKKQFINEKAKTYQEIYKMENTNYLDSAVDIYLKDLKKQGYSLSFKAKKKVVIG